MKENEATDESGVIAEYLKALEVEEVEKLRGLMNKILTTPNDTAYTRWSCQSGLKPLCKLCRTSPPPAMGARYTVFGHAGHADPLDDLRFAHKSE